MSHEDSECLVTRILSSLPQPSFWKYNDDNLSVMAVFRLPTSGQ